MYIVIYTIVYYSILYTIYIYTHTLKVISKGFPGELACSVKGGGRSTGGRLQGVCSWKERAAIY